MCVKCSITVIHLLIIFLTFSTFSDTFYQFLQGNNLLLIWSHRPLLNSDEHFNAHFYKSGQPSPVIPQLSLTHCIGSSQLLLFWPEAIGGICGLGFTTNSSQAKPSLTAAVCNLLITFLPAISSLCCGSQVSLFPAPAFLKADSVSYLTEEEGPYSHFISSQP